LNPIISTNTAIEYFLKARKPQNILNCLILALILNATSPQSNSKEQIHEEQAYTRILEIFNPSEVKCQSLSELCTRLSEENEPNIESVYTEISQKITLIREETGKKDSVEEK